MKKEQATTFPTAPDADGFFYETEDEQEMGIETKIHKNDNKVKRAVLDGGKIAIVRELTGKDTKDIARFMGKDQEKYTMSGIAVATTINESKQTYEFFEAMKMKSYNKLLAMFYALNF